MLLLFCSFRGDWVFCGGIFVGGAVVSRGEGFVPIVVVEKWGRLELGKACHEFEMAG